jgi:uncharacterized protein
MAYNKPLPWPNPDDKPFWDACRRHELKFQKCLQCGLVRWPAALICPECHSDETKWIKVSGRGKVYTYAVYHQIFHPGFEAEIPYVTASVELEEGPRLLSNIINCPPDQIRCEMDVSVVFEDVTPEISLPKFEPVE